MSTLPNPRNQTGMPPARVAVIAVHGVADQRPGDTARAVAALLVNAAEPGVRYADNGSDHFVLSVQPVKEAHPHASATRGMLAQQAAPADRPAPPPPTLAKSIRQSLGSDFLRPGWVAPAGVTKDAGAEADGSTAAPDEPPTRSAAAEEQAPQTLDQGTDFTDYLFFKANRNGAAPEPYESTRIHLTRTSAEGTQAIDLHEMYWADLSRLSGAVPRVVSELFTLVFRFARLGRDAVDQTRKHKAARSDPHVARWALLSRLQTGLDLALTALLSNLLAQLLLVGVFIMALAVVRPVEHGMRYAIASALPALGAWWVLYRYAVARWMRFGTIAAAGLAAYLLMVLPATAVQAVVLLGLLVVALDACLRVADARFPATRACGLAFLGVTLALLLGHRYAAYLQGGAGSAFDAWIVAALRTTEYLLLGLAAWWVVVPFAMLAWFAAGWRAGGADAADRRSVATGRLGLFFSITVFMMFTMALWALVTHGAEIAAQGIPYAPTYFTVPQTATGDAFLHARYRNSTQTFPLIAGLLLVVALLFAAMIAPSVFAERKTPLGTAQNLGRWLSGGYRGVDRTVTLVVGIGILMGMTVGALLFMARFDLLAPPLAQDYMQAVARLSEQLLKPLVFGTATITATVAAFGRTLSRFVPSLRLPLDVALDVDNHFREFPRTAIPRARIFARYVALLEHIAAQDYDRVVIVAHSQGTVISAELLRHLKSRADDDERIARLWRRLDGRLAVLTAGCPLRQLYAARFPALYPWTTAVHEGRSGPLAGDIGAERWVNLYTTGDYVGRWLWPGEMAPDGSDPTLYDPSRKPDFEAGRQTDICLGSGAHTHYFDHDQGKVAYCIDFLVGEPLRRAGRVAAAAA